MYKLLCSIFILFSISIYGMDDLNIKLNDKEKDSKRHFKIKSDIATCFNCKKTHRIETIRRSVFDPLKKLYCNVCGTKLYERKAKVIDYKIIKN